MSVSIKVQKPGFQFPFERRNFVAEAWRDSVLIWGGFTDGLRAPHDPKVVQYSDRKSGGWIAKSTRGDYPPWSSSLHVLTAHVLNDKLYVLGFDHLQRAEPVLVYSLDLNSWTWIKISPSGTTPNTWHWVLSCWIHNGKIFCFGLAYQYEGNRLFCYNTTNNTWEWPDQGGEVPLKLLGHSCLAVGDNVYLFGGCSRDPSNRYRGMNDLYILDMLTMSWKRVHNNTRDPRVPSGEIPYLFTKVSESTALLIKHPRMVAAPPWNWLLDLNRAQQLQEPSSLWTRIPDQIPGRLDGACVIEPISQRLWIIGGNENNNERMDIVEISTRILSLKELAINSAALHIPAGDPRLQCGQLPKMLKNQIETHRTNIRMQ